MNPDRPWLTARCLCGWPVTPDVTIVDGRLLVSWDCQICGAEWHHYERVEVSA